MQTKFITLELENGGIILTKPHKIESILSLDGWVVVNIGSRSHRLRGSLKDLETKMEAYDNPVNK